MSASILKAGTYVERAGTILGASPSRPARSRVAELEEALADERQRLATALAEEGQKVRLQCQREALEEWGHASAAVRAAAEEFQKQTRAGFQVAHDEIVELALAVAAKVVRRAVADDAEFTSQLIQRALERITHRSEVRVRVHPDDLAKVSAECASISSTPGAGHTLTVVADRRVGRGGVLLETPEYIVDATLEGQLAAAKRALKGSA